MDRSAAARHLPEGVALTQVVALRVADVPAVSAQTGPRPQQCLGQQDADRLARMTSLRRRQQFLAGRWLAREVAAEFTGSDASMWRTATAENGAAQLIAPDTASVAPLHLSLSHSDDKLAVAVAGFPVGVDVESTTGRTRDWLGLAGRTFAAEECACLHGLDEAGRRRWFFRYWTLREAAGKRAGTGLLRSGNGHGAASECEPHRACAMTWDLAGFCLAVVGHEDMRVDARGIPDEVRPRHWTFDAVSRA